MFTLVMNCLGGPLTIVIGLPVCIHGSGAMWSLAMHPHASMLRMPLRRAAEHTEEYYKRREACMGICLSHGGPSTYSSSAPSHEVLVGTVRGVVTIHRGKSGDWQVSSSALEHLHISALMIEPRSGLIFAGAHQGSLYASSDLGKSWEPRDRGLTQKDVYCLNSVVQDDKVKIYAGTEPAHLFESEDLGETWHELTSLLSVPSVSKWTFPGPPHLAHVKNITFDPRDPRVIYVTVEVGGVLKSRDGGSSWEELHGFDTDISFDLPEGAYPDDVHRLLVRPSNPERLYISGGIGICHSQDGGSSWEHLTTTSMRVGYPDALLIHPGRDDLMFTGGAMANPRSWRETHVADAGIARSRDGGKSWEVLHQGLPERIRGNIEAMGLEVWNGSCSLFAGTTDGEIFYSDDEGDSWAKIMAGLPPISKGGHYLRLQ